MMRRPVHRALLAALACLALIGVALGQSQPRLFLPLVQGVPGTPGPTVTATTVATATATTTATVGATATATATPEPVTLVVRSTVRSTVRVDRSSFLEILGEVENTGVQTGYYGLVTARFYNASDQLVAISDGFTLLSRIDPGQRIPLRVVLANPPAGITRHEVTATAGTSTVADLQPLPVLSQQVRNNSGPEVFGEARHTYARRMRNARVVVTFYDAAGNVVYADSGTVNPSTLAANATGTYVIPTFNESLAFDSFIVQAEGELFDD
jgi:hypothetical protein